MTCMGVVKNFDGLVACRVILGVFEVQWLSYIFILMELTHKLRPAFSPVQYISSQPGILVMNFNNDSRSSILLPHSQALSAVFLRSVSPEWMDPEASTAGVGFS